MQKNLIILRHAKAETAKAGQEDHDRPLAERGLEEAQRMGEYMRAQDIQPERILCSTALRTRQTLDELHMDGEIEFSPSLYNASDVDHLRMIAAEPDTTTSLMLIAHNPGLHQLALRLAATGETRLMQYLAAEFPPCTLVVIDFSINSWQEIATIRGALRIYATPRMI